MNKTDIELKQDIEQELLSDPRVNAAQIGVSVDRSAVSLLGTVDTLPQKWAAEEATRRVAGVRTVAENLLVKLVGEHVRSDSDVALGTQFALTWDVHVPKTVTARVANGEVTLEGEVVWNYQREAAARAVCNLAGVVAVHNAITLRQPPASNDSVREKVESALRRRATAEAGSIHVDTDGGRVTLSGQAASWNALKDATQAAWSAPGVTEVIDHVDTSTAR